MAKSNSSATVRVCKADHCNKPAIANKSYCGHHDVFCTVVGCESVRDGGPFCNYHRNIARKHGVDAAHRDHTWCAADNCDRIAKFSRSNYCTYHQTHCHVEGCENKKQSKGILCGMHASRRQRKKVIKSGRVCSQSGCTLPVECNGLCSKHYAKQRRYGSVADAPGTERGLPLAWLQKLVTTTPITNECIEWPFNTDINGYGVLSTAGHSETPLKAHRVSLALYLGMSLNSLPASRISTRHLCPKGHNRKCVNPLHLAFGTHQENMQDSVQWGIQRGERNPGSILTEWMAIQIILDPRQPEKIANQYPISEAQVIKIKGGHAWKYLHERLNTPLLAA